MPSVFLKPRPQPQPTASHGLRPACYVFSKDVPVEMERHSRKRFDDARRQFQPRVFERISPNSSGYHFGRWCFGRPCLGDRKPARTGDQVKSQTSREEPLIECAPFRSTASGPFSVELDPVRRDSPIRRSRCTLLHLSDVNDRSRI